MGTPLGQPPSSSAPSLSLPAIGTRVAVALIDIEQRHSTDFATGKPKYWHGREVKTEPSPDPVMSPVLIAEVLATQGATLGSNETERPAQPGDIVSIYCEGSNYVEWQAGLKALGEQPQTGYIVTHVFDREEPGRGNNRKVRTFTVRPPAADKPNELAIAQRCEAAYQERHSTPLGAPPAAAPAPPSEFFNAPAPAQAPSPSAAPAQAASAPAAAQPVPQQTAPPEPFPQPPAQAAPAPAAAPGGEEWF